MSQRRPRQAMKKHAQRRCPVCRYFHTGPQDLCVTCQAAFSTNGVLLGCPIVPTEENQLISPMLGPAPGSGPVQALELIQGHELVATPDADSFQTQPDTAPPSELETPPRRGHPHARRTTCACCIHPQRAALDAALHNPLDTMGAIAARYGCTLYTLTRHRRQCLDIPALTLHERGRRTQFLRKSKGEAAFLHTTFLTRVTKEVARINAALAQNDSHIAALHAIRDSLLRQGEALREYLRGVGTQQHQESSGTAP